MARGDNRRTPKARRRQRQRKLKDRLKRRREVAQAGKAAAAPNKQKTG